MCDCVIFVRPQRLWYVIGQSAATATSWACASRYINELHKFTMSKQPVFSNPNAETSSMSSQRSQPSQTSHPIVVTHGKGMWKDDYQ